MDIKEVLNKIIGVCPLTFVDYTVVGISLGVALVFGMYHGLLFTPSHADFLIGGRQMTPAPVAVSTAMLYLFVLTIIEKPADFYYHGIESFMISIVTVIVIPLSFPLFVSMFHSMQLTSIHQYIGHRFDSAVLRSLTSFAFIVHETVYICVMLGAVSYTLELYFDVPILTSVIGLGVFTAINTTLGGFKATVWTQVFYYFWVATFLTLLTVVAASKADGFLNAFELAAKHNRLNLFKVIYVMSSLQVDPFMPQNLFNFVVGYGFTVLMKVTTDQSIVQRYSSITTRRDAMKSIFMSIPLYVFPSLLCLAIGVFLQASYAGCDPITLSLIEKPHDIVPYFIKKNLSFIPGAIGIFVATIVGSFLCAYSTSINSVTACFYQDFASKIRCYRKPGEEREDEPSGCRCCRIISFSYVVATCAVVAGFLTLELHHTDKSLQIGDSFSNLVSFNSILYGPLAAIFLMGMFLPCVNKYGATIGFLGGVAFTGYIAIRKIMISSTTPTSLLPPIMGKCPDASALNVTALFRFLPWHPKDENDPQVAPLNGQIDDLISVSYLLLTLLGAVVTVIISFSISIISGGLCTCFLRKLPANLLHPVLGCCCSCCSSAEDQSMQQAMSHRYVDRISYRGSGVKLTSAQYNYDYSSLTPTPTPR